MANVGVEATVYNNEQFHKLKNMNEWKTSKYSKQQSRPNIVFDPTVYNNEKFHKLKNMNEWKTSKYSKQQSRPNNVRIQTISNTSQFQNNGVNWDNILKTASKNELTDKIKKASDEDWKIILKIAKDAKRDEILNSLTGNERVFHSIYKSVPPKEVKEIFNSMSGINGTGQRSGLVLAKITGIQTNADLLRQGRDYVNHKKTNKMYSKAGDVYKDVAKLELESKIRESMEKKGIYTEEEIKARIAEAPAKTEEIKKKKLAFEKKGIPVPYVSRWYREAEQGIINGTIVENIKEMPKSLSEEDKKKIREKAERDIIVLEEGINRCNEKLKLIESKLPCLDQFFCRMEWDKIYKDFAEYDKTKEGLMSFKGYLQRDVMEKQQKIRELKNTIKSTLKKNSSSSRGSTNSSSSRSNRSNSSSSRGSINSSSSRGSINSSSSTSSTSSNQPSNVNPNNSGKRLRASSMEIMSKIPKANASTNHLEMIVETPEVLKPISWRANTRTGGSRRKTRRTRKTRRR